MYRCCYNVGLITIGILAATLNAKMLHASGNAVLSGRVYDQSKKPLANAEIVLNAEVKGAAGTAAAGTFVSSVSVRTTTSADGSYSIAALPERSADEFAVAVSHDDYENEYRTLRSNNGPQTADFTLHLNKHVAFVATLLKRPVDDSALASIERWIKSSNSKDSFLLSDQIITAVFPYISRLRPYLLRYVSNPSSLAQDAAIRYKVMQILTLWGDPDDKSIALAWWKAFEKHGDKSHVMLSKLQDNDIGHATYLDVAGELNPDGDPYSVTTVKVGRTKDEGRVILNVCKFDPKRKRMNPLHSTPSISREWDIIATRRDGKWYMHIYICTQAND